MQEKKFTLEVGGRTLEAKFSPLAEQADGSVLVTYGGTVALVTVVMGRKDRLELGYFPLMVDYEEKYYAAGKIYGSRFVRRESRPSEIAVLTGRMIDRTIRPRFDHRMRRDVQIVTTILSIDGENDPDFPALIGASLALGVSPVPFDGPVAGIRIAKNGDFVLCPSYEARTTANLDVFVGGTAERINMIEVAGKFVPEEDALKSIELAQNEIKKLVKWQKDIISEMGKEKAAVVLSETDPALTEAIKKFLDKKLEEAVFTKNKAEREAAIGTLKKDLMAHLETEGKTVQELGIADNLFEEEIDVLVHKKIINEEKRPDGRKLDELRPIQIELGILPRTHGSAVFARGNTHALSVTTLGSPGDILLQQGMEVTGEKRFIHHYNFPNYSVGEVGPNRGPGRREIGHGALAEKAVVPLIPPKEEFPYTIRVVSEILSSNGSSSMASVCGTSLSLMHAGVPIKEHAAGIAMGLMSDAHGKYKVLTDIQGPEDHHGDMDCKVAGTKDGVTAIQMDVKIEGVTLEMLGDTLTQAKKARLEILEKMNAVIPNPSPNLSPFSPRIITLTINPDKIRDVIGPGGKMINTIIAETGVQIDIEDSGLIFITAVNEEAATKAVEWIKNLTRELKAGEILQGKVIKILDFGAIVELLPGQEGMVHISELASFHVRTVHDIVKIGDVVPVKIKEIQSDGKIRLSLRDARKELGEQEPAPPEGYQNGEDTSGRFSSTRHRRY